MINRVFSELNGKKITLETGQLARQADGAVYVSYGDTRVLVTVCSGREPRVGIDFFPLTVEFAEKFYASGKIPGSFHRREGRPTQEATLSARMIDRPIRPLFPENYFYDTQIVATILSVDPEADVDVAAALGASAALHISDIPFRGPTAACRVGRVGGQWVINPSWSQVETGETDLDIFVAGTKNAVMMVEGCASELPEEDVLAAIIHGHEQIKKLVQLVEDLRNLCGKTKRVFSVASENTKFIGVDFLLQVEAFVRPQLVEALRVKDKQKRQELIRSVKATVEEKWIMNHSFESSDQKAFCCSQISVLFETLQYQLMRQMILKEKVRIDGRQVTEIRPITTQVGLLPRAHGSALFTRGETQVLATVTLGTSEDEQIIDTMFQNAMRKFMLHYNFPPFSVGETGRLGGQSRREIGHGALAERSIHAMMPEEGKFPYTVRIVCETLESNGSSSMASVCSASMALMDAGVPFPKAVAGIAMGLIKEQDQVAVLSDILGDEDHLGDMDFKVAGTQEGVTGIQMDIKIEGVDASILQVALAQARAGRLHILNEMQTSIQTPRLEMSLFAPKITTITVPVDKIREVIGSGGKVIKDIIAQTGCKIDISDDGVVHIASHDGKASQKAIQIIQGIIAEVELGKVYQGVVKKIVEFGAFVGVLPNQDGLLHISEIAHERVNHVMDYLKEGDTVEVKVVEIDKMGKVRLSRKVLLPMPEGPSAEEKARGNTKRPFHGKPSR